MIKLQGKSRIINYDERIDLLRDGPVSFDNEGKAIRLQPPTNFQVKANVQPLGGKDLLLVPEGDRSKEQYWLWSDFKIRVNDRVVRKGVKFQVQTVQDWGSYTQSRMVRIDVGSEAN